MHEPVLVSGSSGGIGAAIVERLEQDGHAVIGLDLAAPPGPAPTAGMVLGDVTEAETLSEAAAAARGAGGLWGLVHCAGVYPLCDLEDYDVAAWDRVHDVNVRAAFRLATTLRDQLVDGGRITMVASAAAFAGSRDVGYSASKAGLVGLVRGLSLELARRDVLVNAVAPGVVDTPMSAGMPPERRARHLANTPLGRAGRPAEVAAAVAFLMDARNSFMTGAVLDVTGGLHLR